MSTAVDSSNDSEGEEFFDKLNSKSQKTYSNLYDFLMHVTNELTQDQTFYIMDLADILKKIQVWKEKLPDITPFYAVKTNSDPVLLRLLILLGFSFDCSTKGEIDLILQHGGKIENIIYAHTVKQPTSLEYAKKLGVDLMTFDSKEELHKIKKYYPEARSVLRIKCDNPNCTFNLSLKYGCCTDKSEDLLKLAKELDLKVIGLSFHVGALCHDPESYSQTIHNCHTIFEIADKLGFKFEILDIGGGFSGAKGREELFDTIATKIRDKLEECFSKRNVRVIAEPGTYFAGSSQRNVTCVIGSMENRNTPKGTDDKEGVERDVFINDGIYGSFFDNCEDYDITFKPLLKKEEVEKRPKYKSKIWGQTCDSEDVIVKNILLTEMKYGEYLVWENMGAYALNFCSAFTSVPLPLARYIFLKNPGLHLNWIENPQEIEDFITKTATLIEDENFP